MGALTGSSSRSTGGNKNARLSVFNCHMAHRFGGHIKIEFLWRYDRKLSKTLR